MKRKSWSSFVQERECRNYIFEPSWNSILESRRNASWSLEKFVENVKEYGTIGFLRRTSTDV
jgi:hypothetical protein